MNALTRPNEFDAIEANISRRGEAIPLPLIATRALFTSVDAGRCDPPRREPWPGEELSAPWYSRIVAAIGRALEPRKPRYPLTEHLCRDIGLDWKPEPRVRTWPW